MHAYERWMALQYLERAIGAKAFRQPPSLRHDIFRWVKEYRRILALPSLQVPTKGLDFSEDLAGYKEWAADWKNWRSKTIDRCSTQQPTQSPLQKRIDLLCDACEFNASQRPLLGLVVRVALVPCVGDLIAAINDQFSPGRTTRFDFSEHLPVMDADIDERDLEEGAILRRLNFVVVDQVGNFRLSDLIRRILAGRVFNPHRIREEFLGPCVEATLAWDEFAHIGDIRDLAARVIAEAGRSKKPGAANILIYGPPGTGKSEFAKTLGAHLGHAVRFVGEMDNKSGEPNRRDRIAGLVLANAIGGIVDRTIVVVDEADDLFTGVDEGDAASRQGSKVFMNRLVETTSGPTIWITNNPDRLGPAVVRRMNLVVRFPRPSLTVRKKMIERIAARAEFHLTAGETAKLARLPAAPALIENAIRSAARIEGSGREAQQILECGLKAMGLEETTLAPAPLPFDPALSSADIDLLKLADRVGGAATTALSFCLSGPPGTGKSAYARYIAERLGMEILDKRYSDLISSFLGESEKAIAQAFEEAADLRAFLILDEADSLLRDRGAARHSWEITQVNEMLCAMERHPFPFACTTNAPDLLDQATARRFLFKVRFLAMDEKQIALAFRRAFKAEATQSTLALEHLTPGDFAVVARKAAALDERGMDQIAKWLEEEVRAKPEARKVRIGF
jgi:transitional endoplasmic reticulum ATPase